MSSDQWDPKQVVRLRLILEDGTERWSRRLERAQAETHLASAAWLAYPLWRGERVASAAIVVWTLT